MNEERFRELARQAGVLIDWGEDIKVGRWGIGGNYKNMQKFAELIVRECVAQCEQVATAADAKSKSKFVTDDGRMLHEGMWGGAKNCSGQIKQHFGVEE
jgi:hypothetical protein